MEVIGFMGPISGGKTYNAYKLKEEYEKRGKSVLLADFSDGIREFISGSLFGIAKDIDTTSEYYYIWKNKEIPVEYFDGNVYKILGRDILKNTANTMKKFFGNDIFAKYTVNKTLDTSYDLIIFSSIRYPEELKSIFYNYENARIIMCNYHNETHKENICESESLINNIMKLNNKNGDDITEICKKFIDMEQEIKTENFKEKISELNYSELSKLCEKLKSDYVRTSSDLERAKIKEKIDIVSEQLLIF